MTVRPTLVTFVWDAVAGSTGYDLLRDGVKVASTRTGLKTQVKVLSGGHKFEVSAKPSGTVQSLDMRYEEGAPPDPGPPSNLTARSSIQAGDHLVAGSTVDWSVAVSSGGPADACEWFVDGASVHKITGSAQIFHYQWAVPRAATVGFEVSKGAAKAGVRSFPVVVS